MFESGATGEMVKYSADRWIPGQFLEPQERKMWGYTPFGEVGPLKFGMRHEDVVAVLGEKPSRFPFVGHDPSFEEYESRSADFYETRVTVYYDEFENLVFVAVDALYGPQVSMDGISLVGRPPSEVGAQFYDYAESRGVEAFTSQQGDPGADEFGVVLRAQRCGDVLLSRPVFAAREWARNIADTGEGLIPKIEWLLH